MKRRSTRCFRQRLQWRGRFAALALCLTGSAALAAEPYRPASDDVVLERLPAIADANLQALADLREKLAANPDDLALAVELARRYSALGSAEGDPRYYAYAQAVLQPWLAQQNPPPQVRLLRARFLQHRHQFADALDELAHVLRQDPRAAQAWLTKAMILRVLGRYDAAAASCQPLLTLADPTLTAICLTSVNSLRGRLAASYRQLKRVAERQLGADHSQWAATALAQMAEQLGDPEAAAAHYRQALAVDRRDVYLLAAYADFLLDQNRPQEVRALLADERAVDPLLLRLAIAERRSGDERWRRHAGLLQQRFDALRLRGDEGHLREQARAALELSDRPAAALELALANWAVQREPEDARLVLQAALAASQPQAAAAVVDWLQTTQLEDARLAPLIRQVTEART
jgi:hypothetical protein